MIDDDYIKYLIDELSEEDKKIYEEKLSAIPDDAGREELKDLIYSIKQLSSPPRTTPDISVKVMEAILEEQQHALKKRIQWFQLFGSQRRTQFASIAGLCALLLLLFTVDSGHLTGGTTPSSMVDHGLLGSVVSSTEQYLSQCTVGYTCPFILILIPALILTIVLLLIFLRREK